MTVRWMYRMLLAASVALIALGGATRAVNAGLACPDWPLCFWQVVPDMHYEVYYEFMHRALAGIVGLLVIGLQGYILFHSNSRIVSRVIAIAAISVLLAQIVLGALTVLKLLNAHVVTLHLTFGVALFCLLLWNYWLEISPPNKQQLSSKLFFTRPFRWWTLFLSALIYAQVILGGLVSTNYAGLACPDFPKCLGQWVPTLQGLIGLHVLHRFGAYLVCALVGLNFLWLWQRSALNKISQWLVLLILIQLGLGIANVIYRIPPLITVLHLVIGVSLLGTALLQMHVVWRYR